MEQGRTQADMSNSIDALLTAVAGLTTSQQSQRNEIEAQRSQINTLIEELRKSRAPSATPEPALKRSYDLHEVEDTHILQHVDRLQKTIKQKWDTPKVILDGNNFLKWKQTIRSDAMLIKAANILDNGETSPPYESTDLEVALWKARNDALHTRIWKSLNTSIQEILTPLEAVDASPLWELINAKFGITEAQERYNLVRDMCSLEIEDSDYFAFQTKWQHFDAAARRLNMTYDDIHHDLFLQGLRNWQKHYIGIRLDEFFATGTSNRPIRNIDLDGLKRELQNRATTPNQPHRDHSMAGKDVSKSRNQDSTMKSTSETDNRDIGNEERCYYCNSRRHAPPGCWFKDLSLATPEWITQRFDGIKAVRERNGDSTPGLRELTLRPP